MAYKNTLYAITKEIGQRFFLHWVQVDIKKLHRGWSNSTAGKELVLQVTDPDLIPTFHVIPRAPPVMIPELRDWSN